MLFFSVSFLYLYLSSRKRYQNQTVKTAVTPIILTNFPLFPTLEKRINRGHSPWNVKVKDYIQTLSPLFIVAITDSVNSVILTKLFHTCEQSSTRPYYI